MIHDKCEICHKKYTKAEIAGEGRDYWQTYGGHIADVHTACIPGDEAIDDPK